VPRRQPADSTETTYRARLRYAPISSRKARPIVDLVRGQSVNAALEQLQYINRRSAVMLRGLIQSAMANATQDGKADVNDLYVKYIVANEGPLKQKRLRYRPGPQGRAMPFRKRMTHFELMLGVRESTKARRRPRRDRPGAKPEAGAPEAAAPEAAQKPEAAAAKKPPAGKKPAKQGGKE
jgi:large subunit ribosomal protein L22